MAADELTPIIKQVPAAKRDLAKKYATEIRFMRKKLLQARKCIGEAEIVIPYDNGGGQMGLRANPAYSEYERLFNTYNKATQSLLNLIPEAKAAKQPEKQASKLDSMRASLRLVGGA